jgi:hypothetical protein
MNAPDDQIKGNDNNIWNSATKNIDIFKFLYENYAVN